MGCPFTTFRGKTEGQEIVGWPRQTVLEAFPQAVSVTLSLDSELDRRLQDDLPRIQDA